jgi:cephalosporin hydroxylase
MGTADYHEEVPDNEAFVRHRLQMRAALAQDLELHSRALSLQEQAAEHEFGYHWEWCGVPIIRLPDDIVLFQEIVWAIRPACIVETGVARGGSVALSASLMHMNGSAVRVLGLDIRIHAHTWDLLGRTPFADEIQLWEGDSSSVEAAEHVSHFLAAGPEGPALLVLDSNHTHEHVLSELRVLGSLLPIGSLILVADTLIEEMPPDHYLDRPWSRGNNPATAIREFLSETDTYAVAPEWSRRGLLTEFRDGILIRQR